MLQIATATNLKNGLRKMNVLNALNKVDKCLEIGLGFIWWLIAKRY